MLLLIETDKEDFERVKSQYNRGLLVSRVMCAVAHGTPIEEGDAISREKTKELLFEYFGCKDATKYGNKDAQQVDKSYSTMMLYEIADNIEDALDNAPSLGAKTGTNKAIIGADIGTSNDIDASRHNSGADNG